MKFYDPEGGFILKWNKTFLLCSVIALSLDPLFLYIPIVNGTQKCLDMDRNLAIAVCVLRSFADIIYVFHIIIKFRTAHVPSYDRIHGKKEFIDEPGYVAKRYLTSYFIIDVLAALPLPQFAVFVIITNMRWYTHLRREDLLKDIIFYQFVPRVIQAFLLYQKMTKISGFLIETAWAAAAFNFFVYVLASHVVGALWYFFAIQSNLRCWRDACKRHNGHPKYLYCGERRVGDYGFLGTSCPLLEPNEIKDSTNFDFGIFLDVLQTGVLESRDFREKILYCLWLGLQSLSSLGQGLKASTFHWEVLFADSIAIIGLVLFALLISNVQKYLQSFSNLTLRMEEMKEKRREAEDLMSYMSLPEELRQRVRRHKQYKWKITRGVELDSFVRDLPWNLKMDIKRHLCLPSLKRVPIFNEMDEHLLDAMCDRLKPVLYTENCYLVREGDPAHEMLFITSGKLVATSTNSFLGHYYLKPGDFCGEELVTWALDSNMQQHPFSTTTLKAVTDVQAFALGADDLLFIASQFSCQLGRRLRHTFRHSSQQWRTWAAYYIQAAWRKHCKRKRANKRLHDALATGSETSRLSIGASIYVSRFSSKASRIVRRKRRDRISNSQVSTRKQERLLRKPTQPNCI